jgi:hypothetical protein
MRRKLMRLLAVVIILGLTTTAAWAYNPHLSSSLSASVGSLIAEVQAAGLDPSQPVYFGLRGLGTGTAVCVNPVGKQVRGKNAISVDVDVISDLVEAQDNGSASVTLETNAPFPSPKAAGCPNGFTVSVFNVDWTGAIVTLLAADKTTIDQNIYSCNTTDTSTGTTIKCKPS